LERLVLREARVVIQVEVADLNLFRAVALYVRVSTVVMVTEANLIQVLLLAVVEVVVSLAAVEEQAVMAAAWAVQQVVAGRAVIAVQVAPAVNIILVI
jgi:hypothetical protein